MYCYWAKVSRALRSEKTRSTNFVKIGKVIYNNIMYYLIMYAADLDTKVYKFNNRSQNVNKFRTDTQWQTC